MYQVQNDHPEADQSSYLPRTMGILAGHQVRILPHLNSEETALLHLLLVESQSIPVQNLAVWPVHSPKHSYKNNETHTASLPEDGHNSVPNLLKPLNSFMNWQKPYFGAFICAMIQTDTLSLSQGICHNRCLNREHTGHMNNLSLHGKWPYQSSQTRESQECLQEIQVGDWGKINLW